MMLVLGIISLSVLITGCKQANPSTSIDVNGTSNVNNTQPTTIDDTSGDNLNENSNLNASINTSPNTTNSNTSNTNTNTDDTKSVTKGVVKKFEVHAANFLFDVKEIRVKKGDTVKIEFYNDEGFHDWVVDEFNARTQQIAAGKTDEVTFVADKTGTFEYYCSVGKHRAMGMKGNLIVE